MAWPTSLQVGLKEWATVCRALETGRQMILLRKGGISEGGEGFEVENEQFLLFPTYLHQNLAMLKPDAQAGFQPRSDEPAEIPISAAGVVTDIVELQSRQQIDAIDQEHVWTAPLIEMRFNYRPKNPLYLLLVRAYRLHEPTVIDNVPAYAGCKSWVPLSQPISTGAAMPVMDEVKYNLRRESILKRLA